MNGEERRSLIISRLGQSDLPVSAGKFAEEFSVTRQIVVADIALLRASGYSIRAERRGYVLDRQIHSGELRRVVVKHGAKELREELYAFVDNGAKILDVIVDHAIYGTISAQLNFSTRYDVDCFVEKVATTDAKPLSMLTEGLHIHTFIPPNQDAFERIIKKLTELGVYIESN